MVKAYACTPGASPDKAWEFFQRTGGDYAPKMLESLAELELEAGHVRGVVEYVTEPVKAAPRIE